VRRDGEAAEYLQKAFTYTTGDAVGANYSVASNNFATGKTAMVIDGPWLMGSLPRISAARSPSASRPPSRTAKFRTTTR
jgi:raffinose/stachyose/melibiose transport system substrate-binding protein